MQQTETYKLNLIEKTDAFSPDPLNENMEKVETAITAAAAAEAAARQSADAALDARITVLEARRIAIGFYEGDLYGSETAPKDVLIGFTPKFVAIIRSATAVFAAEGVCTAYEALSIIEGGFQVRNTDRVFLNTKETLFHYLAIL